MTFADRLWRVFETHVSHCSQCAIEVAKAEHREEWVDTEKFCANGRRVFWKAAAAEQEARSA